MDKNKLLEIFNEVLENWCEAEDVVINDRSISLDDEYAKLEQKRKEYVNKFLEALNE